ncbi:1,2-dihydroxy-3-keto-5-methylthiopentene dioxygenase [Streptomyces turgidiscabies]|uniref:Acireductone dioxygenase n=1 Tax=Streptomyces turgidiscabies (strain Car8) TaxID=698760 RepID=L7FIY4_STRT8|nr:MULTISPECIES: cupin domain-containing protein [Streptomyces]ELP71353.1 ARD/ARD' family protein [Streptomyces turgidiscabies Car8]MDX3493740.1 cupin domain-containing protein [Streptomyces turgidiscabies]GAQ71666.1 acireductone dioxygenase [Streptomyces turgidiscabies]
MTLLTTWPESGPETVVRRTSDPAEIAAALAPIGVRYEQWPIREDVPADADSDTVFAAYGPEIDKLNAEEGFTTVDVLGLHPSDDPEFPAKAKAARAKFLQEHTHDDDDEVRFFVSGSGIFYLHVDGEVHAVYCEKGDLLGVPRGTTHWFDMGTSPAFTAIRFFHEEDGWIGNFTGSPIASRFPDYDTIDAGLQQDRAAA